MYMYTLMFCKMSNSLTKPLWGLGRFLDQYKFWLCGKFLSSVNFLVSRNHAPVLVPCTPFGIRLPKRKCWFVILSTPCWCFFQMLLHAAKCFDMNLIVIKALLKYFIFYSCFAKVRCRGICEVLFSWFWSVQVSLYAL